MENNTVDILLKRKSIRVYEKREIEENIKNKIIECTLRSPSAGNMMMYSIIEIEDQKTKDTLAKTCDNQPFIASAPWVLVFLADFSKWVNYFKYSKCDTLDVRHSTPKESDFIMCVNDAMIAAQTSVIAAESFGIGSCYIGDIIENFETHRELLKLPRYTFPITMVCFGYPTEVQKKRPQPPRFDRKFVVFKNEYKELEGGDFDTMFDDEHYKKITLLQGTSNYGQHMYVRKFVADFCEEMRRSVLAALKEWK